MHPTSLRLIGRSQPLANEPGAGGKSVQNSVSVSPRQRPKDPTFQNRPTYDDPGLPIEEQSAAGKDEGWAPLPIEPLARLIVNGVLQTQAGTG